MRQSKMDVWTGILLCVFLFGSLESLPVSEIERDLSIYFETTYSGQGRIIGGKEAGPGAHPWMVAFTRGVSPRALVCGGSLVTRRTVLTAAHCIVPRLNGPNNVNDDIRLVTGTNLFGSGGQAYSVAGVAVHPHYNRTVIKNDVGTMFTATEVTFSDLVSPIALAFDFAGAGIPARVAGWGMTVTTADGPASPRLLELETHTISGERCVSDCIQAALRLGDDYAPPVDPRIEICTFHSDGRGNCRGDSGSALVRTDRNQQIGIVSWGFLCALSAPDMYVRVSAFSSWIQENTR